MVYLMGTDNNSKKKKMDSIIPTWVRSRVRYKWTRRILILVVFVYLNAIVLEMVINMQHPVPCSAEQRRAIELYKADISILNQVKQKAAIHYLIQATQERIDKLIESLQSLDKHFNDRFSYPVILFHEDDLRDDMRQRLTRATRSHLIFQNISDAFLKSTGSDVPARMFGSGMGYRHMCRFQAKTVYDLPIMKSLDYAWRLDDDSILLGDVTYDIFAYMFNNNITYGYRHINSESIRRSYYLWSTVRTYINDNHIKTHHFDEWPERQQFYNNFEVSSMKLWYSAEYQAYIDMIDRSEGTYYHGWGDAPIKSIAVAMFVPLGKIHKFCDIPYEHRNLYT